MSAHDHVLDAQDVDGVPEHRQAAEIDVEHKVRDGEAEGVISAVLSGATNRCQGSRDPWYRIDQAEAQEFLACVVRHQYDPAGACRECSAEAGLGLCAD